MFASLRNILGFFGPLKIRVTLPRILERHRVAIWPGKCAKVSFKKISLEKFKNVTLDINTEIAVLEHDKTYKYLGINEYIVINHTIKKKR